MGYPISLRRPDGLAILVERHHGVIETFLEGNAPAYRGRIRPFGDHPACAVGHAGLLEQDPERNAGPFGAGKEAVHGLDIGLPGFRIREAAAVAAAFDEMDA
jgi:hypothetical protein